MTVLSHTHPYADRYKRNTYDILITVVWVTREETSLRSARAVAVVRTCIRTGFMDRSSTVVEKA